ncbi:hypothetical protein LCM02_09960 [Lutimonas saemankumensis]|uniref:hypothetical protein n=1 Tax=Lutimonas saemankumensis TaxID=483016 RepID=UPI001CD3D89C|nr:hypothetical protein [Lutimonas saemankumensis]MCA0932775.1 hypothetical protein [Lutimonas saemankumensis]
MKEIFKSIIGMIVIITLFLVVEIAVQLFVPQLNPFVSVLKGIAIITMILGISIISKSVFDLTFKR